jgi:raffinose/stachyose/melibiose transport system substrate-binding protein
MALLTRRRALLLGAAASVAPHQARAQMTELNFWTWRQEDRAQYAELFKTFTDNAPGVTVRFNAYEPQNYATVLSAALAAGSGPDVIHIRAYGGQEQFSKSGYLHALDTASVPELANFPADALAAMTLRSDKKIYGVPFASQTLGVFINTELFAKQGWKPAADWAEFLDLCRRVKAAGLIPLANGTATAWMVEVFTSVFTGSHLGEAFEADLLSGRATFEDPRYINALTKLTELKEHMPPGFTGIDYPTAQQLFLSGRAAMFAGGSFEIANFRRQNPNLKMAFVAPPAASAGGRRLVSVFQDGGYAINSKSAKKDAALRLIRHLATPQFGTRFSALLGNISPIKGVEVSDPILKSVADLHTASVPYLMAVHFRYDKPTGSELLQSGVQRLMGGQSSATEIGKSITDGIATYFAPFKK